MITYFVITKLECKFISFLNGNIYIYIETTKDKCTEEQI